MNPIVRRELLALLRTREATAVQVALAVICGALVLLRWPGSGVSDLSGARSAQVLRVFGYGLFAGVLFLVPAFPATSLVRERIHGTLALLLNSPMSPLRIYLGKLFGVLGFAAVLLIATVPAAAACYALGGSSTRGGVGWLYIVLAVASIQITTIALWVSLRSTSPDTALRFAYGFILGLAILPLVPHWLTQGDSGLLADIVSWVRCLSPIPAVMEVLGHGAVGTFGMGGGEGAVTRYTILALATSLVFAYATVSRLRGRPLDYSRAAGVMTQDRSSSGQVLRRIFVRPATPFGQHRRLGQPRDVQGISQSAIRSFALDDTATCTQRDPLARTHIPRRGRRAGLGDRDHRWGARTIANRDPDSVHAEFGRGID